MALLELRNLSKAYGEVQALDRLSLSVEEGELVTLLGPSGSGKSTALRIVAGLETADRGAIRIARKDVKHVEPPERGVSMVFQNFALFPHMTVAQNIGFGLAARKTPAEESRRLVAEVAEWLGLSTMLARRPSELSGGERQRVALARGLVRRPRLLLMDEPLSNLDARLRVQTRAEIRRLHAEAQITLVYVTHDQGEALSLGDRVAILDRGRLQQYASPEEVYRQPANRFVAGFLGSPPMNLVDAQVTGTAIDGAGIRVPLAGDVGVSDGDPVILGFRPEHVLIGASGNGEGFEGVLEVSEHIGHERIWHLRVGEQAVIARPAAGDTAAEGDRVRAAVDPDGVRLFDPKTGAAL